MLTVKYIHRKGLLVYRGHIQRERKEIKKTNRKVNIFLEMVNLVNRNRMNYMLIYYILYSYIYMCIYIEFTKRGKKFTFLTANSLLII